MSNFNEWDQVLQSSQSVSEADPVRYLKEKDTVERSIYGTEVGWLRKELRNCLNQHGINHKKYCAPLARFYLETVGNWDTPGPSNDKSVLHPEHLKTTSPDIE